MPVELKGSTSGSVTIAAPAVAGSNTVTMPAVTGTAVVAGQNSALTAMTQQSATSATVVDFSSIPSWVKRITISINGLSVTTGGVANSSIIVQIGYSGGLLTSSSYLGATTALGAGATTTNYSTGFMIETAPTAARIFQGTMVLTNITGNGWCESHAVGTSDSARAHVGGGYASLSGTLDRLRITTQGGTDVFDAGTINVMYE